jgi:pSer/pThr/pTyr-binding forkhead associated (FHA) protein
MRVVISRQMNCPVNAGEYGVSRMHAAITRRNNQLLIADLESMNFTHVYGIRLLPNEIRALQDGDEIRFAQLRC